MKVSRLQLETYQAYCLIKIKYIIEALAARISLCCSFEARKDQIVWDL